MATRRPAPAAALRMPIYFSQTTASRLRACILKHAVDFAQLITDLLRRNALTAIVAGHGRDLIPEGAYVITSVFDLAPKSEGQIEPVRIQAAVAVLVLGWRSLRPG